MRNFLLNNNQLVVYLGNDLPKREAGGKGHSLGILINNGFNVPMGFLITSTAFFQFLDYNGTLSEIKKLAYKITKDNFPEISEQIRQLILKGEIQDKIILQTKEYLDTLRNDYVSIRSSAVSEDSLKASFAGLFESFLSVKPDYHLVLEKVRNCWASLFGERAVIYRIKKEIPHLEGMAVIVQKMIPAKSSGITFTIYPVGGEFLLIESSYGLGDVIVSGEVEPDDFFVDRKTLNIVRKRIGSKKKMSLSISGQIQIMDVGEDLTRKQVMPDNKVKEIAKVCLQIEKIFDYPQNIEWCIYKDKLWLLQSRPITGA